MTTSDLDQTLHELAAFFAGRGVSAWLVGGAARDMARGVAPADIDLAVDGDGIGLSRDLAEHLGGTFVPLDGENSTGRVVLPARVSAPALVIDVARLRAPSIEGDLRLRDFTVNAIAIPLAEPWPDSRLLPPASWIDPTGGLADLRAGVLRAGGPASMADDPLRILRAARMGAALGLRATPELAGQIRAAAPGLARVSAERVRDELLKLLDCPSSAPWLRYLDACGALTTVLPELEPARDCAQPRVHFLPVLAHMLETVASLEWVLRGLGGVWAADERPEALPAAVRAHPGLPRGLPYAERYAALMGEARGGGRRRAALLKLATLIHDNAKPQTKQTHPDGKISFYNHQEIGSDVAAELCRRLRLSRRDASYVAMVVREHMRPGQLRAGEVITRRAVARLFRDLGDAGPDVLLHELADHMAVRGPQLRPDHWAEHLRWVGEMLDTCWGQPEERRAPLLRGTDLIDTLGLTPGPQVGAMLRAIAEAQAAGEIASRDEALALARGMLE
ncbi:HD domain-containing protein [Oscillochloris sp. ZM17-4]|uniref:HD domain-containing protein n=1 Tax=Oscillochloris sp. ZM17-4 TaxID=2866714 RepID=UPI001C72A3D4|nr:HD domain-containing protein [Oscillochloris sp. ZM17-4]MBX0330632.1 HD domain-containing protein [Oscillochloris sp. ZM17-4]